MTKTKTRQQNVKDVIQEEVRHSEVQEKKETCGKSGLQMTHIQKKYRKRKVVMKEAEEDEKSMI
jgi:hypothetical protein